MPYLQLSTGGETLERSRIDEKSRLRIMREQAKLQEQDDERRYERNLAEKERQRITDEDARLRKLELESDELGLGVPYRRTTSRTTAPTGSPLQERIRAERGYAEMPVSERISYFEGRIRPALREKRVALKDEPSRRIREEIEAYGGEVPSRITSEAGLKRLRDITVSEDKEQRKERITQRKQQKEAVDIIKWIESKVTDPKTDNVMFRGDPDKEYTLDTFTEAKREMEKRLGSPLTPQQEKLLRAIPYPPDGKDEYEENLKKAEERKIDYQSRLAAGKRAPGKEKETRYEQEQKIKLDNFKFALQRGEYPTKDEDDKPITQFITTQQDAVDVALQEGLNLYDPEVKKAILRLPLGVEEKEDFPKKILPSPYKQRYEEKKGKEKKYKKGQIVEKQGKTWKYLGEGKWEEQTETVNISGLTEADIKDYMKRHNLTQEEAEKKLLDPRVYKNYLLKRE